MPVPQRVNLIVGWASCPPSKALLTIVQDSYSAATASDSASGASGTSCLIVK
jgi:hypothetical protein